MNNTVEIKYYEDLEISIEIISDEKGFDDIFEEWDKLAEKADIHIFQTFEWQRTWWKYFGRGKRLHILLVRANANNRLVGIIPLFIDDFRVWGTPLYNCLRMIGSRVMQPEGGSLGADLTFSDYLSFIVLPGFEEAVCQTLRDYLSNHQHLFDEFILEEIPEGNNLFLPDCDIIDNRTFTANIENASVCPLIRFPNTWDDFLKNLSSNARYQIRRFIRSVTEKNIFEIQTAEKKAEVVKAFDLLVSFHQERWHKLGKPGIFTDNRVLDFFREVTLKFYDRGWLLLKLAKADEKCVAVDLLYNYKGTIYMVQRGFDENSPYSDDSPGSVLLYFVIKESIEEGYKVYDFLRGEESYKLRTANHIAQNKHMVITKKEGYLGYYKFYRSYAHFKRKLTNEYDILNIYTNTKDPIHGFGNYLQTLYYRLKRVL